MLKQVVFSTPEFKAQSKNFVFCHADIINHPEQAAPYNVSAVPDIRFLKNDGTQVHNFLGFRPLPEFLKEMEVALSKK